jgi:hypothetical protein
MQAPNCCEPRPFTCKDAAVGPLACTANDGYVAAPDPTICFRTPGVTPQCSIDTCCQQMCGGYTNCTRNPDYRLVENPSSVLCAAGGCTVCWLGARSAGTRSRT